MENVVRSRLDLNSISSGYFMESPLTPLDFARRARKLYPNREAVVDNDKRFSYADF
jgi:hypothetical protein